MRLQLVLLVALVVASRAELAFQPVQDNEPATPGLKRESALLLDTDPATGGERVVVGFMHSLRFESHGSSAGVAAASTSVSNSLEGLLGRRAGPAGGPSSLEAALHLAMAAPFAALHQAASRCRFHFGFRPALLEASSIEPALPQPMPFDMLIDKDRAASSDGLAAFLAAILDADAAAEAEAGAAEAVAAAVAAAVGADQAAPFVGAEPEPAFLVNPLLVGAAVGAQPEPGMPMHKPFGPAGVDGMGPGMGEEPAHHRKHHKGHTRPFGEEHHHKHHHDDDEGEGGPLMWFTRLWDGDEHEEPHHKYHEQHKEYPHKLHHHEHHHKRGDERHARMWGSEQMAAEVALDDLSADELMKLFGDAQPAAANWVTLEDTAGPAWPPAQPADWDWSLWDERNGLNLGLVIFLALCTGCVAVFVSLLRSCCAHYRVLHESREAQAAQVAARQFATEKDLKTLVPLLHEGPLDLTAAEGKTVQ